MLAQYGVCNSDTSFGDFAVPSHNRASSTSLASGVEACQHCRQGRVSWDSIRLDKTHEIVNGIESVQSRSADGFLKHQCSVASSSASTRGGGRNSYPIIVMIQSAQTHNLHFVPMAMAELHSGHESLAGQVSQRTKSSLI